MINFTKMHGIGNDFVIIENLPSAIENKYEFARKICNRHLGIGADGVIIIYPSKIADKKIEIYNQDGSEASMCGNGVRCVCKYLTDKTASKSIDIETKSGVKHIECIESGNFIAKVDMGIPTFSVDNMALKTDKSVIYNHELKVMDKIFNITCVYVGNLHTVIFVDSLWLTPVDEIALSIQKNSMFLDSTNVEFVEMLSNSHIKVRVFERGCGETLSCGSGACAAVYAAIHLKDAENKVEVELKGGNLIVELNKTTGHIYLSGTAETIFKGTIFCQI